MDGQEPKPADRRQKHKGWRTIGGKKHYFKSLWEANYAYYLQWMKEKGEIKDWEYESQTFWFDKIKRGTNNYTPDFKVYHTRVVTYTDGRKSDIEFVEVKGFMDPKSATKIKRMKIYHSEILLRLIDSKWFQTNGKILSGVVSGWERDS